MYTYIYIYMYVAELRCVHVSFLFSTTATFRQSIGTSNKSCN